MRFQVIAVTVTTIMFWETPTCSSAEIHRYKIQRRFSK